MVWVEIWDNGMNLIRRYNEKFDKVVEFIDRMKNELTACRINGDTVIVYTNENTFRFDCTTKQSQKLIVKLDGIQRRE